MRTLCLTLIINLNLWINWITILLINLLIERHEGLSKVDLVEIVLEIGNRENIEINSQSSSNSLSSWNLSPLSDIDVDYNSSADENICSSDDSQTDAAEQLNWNIFIELFKHKKKS